MFKYLTYINIFMAENKKEDNISTISLKVTTINKLKEYQTDLKDKTNFDVTYDTILNMLIDCVDKDKMNEKSKFLKEIVAL